MRIFQVLEYSSNTAVPSSQTWYRNLYEPLVEMGHDVVLFPAEEGRRAMQYKDTAMRTAFSQKLLDIFYKEHARKPFNLFFAYLMDGMVGTGAIDEIHKTGVPTCNFSCNNAHQFDLVDEISPHFDYNLHSEKGAREKFLSIGAKPLWWPMASNPKYFRPYDVPRTVDASFVGANYAQRASYVWHLLENDVDAHAYGPGWVLETRTLRLRQWLWRNRLLLQALFARTPQTQAYLSAMAAQVDAARLLRHKYPGHVHEPVSDERLIRLYSESRISLGFLEVHQGHDPSAVVTQHLHLREFEAPMSGALYCTGCSDELAEFFKPDEEVLVYRNRPELLDKVRYYLAHPEEAEKVRRAGHARALRDHTYHCRFQTLLREIGLEGR